MRTLVCEIIYLSMKLHINKEKKNIDNIGIVTTHANTL